MGQSARDRSGLTGTDRLTGLELIATATGTPRTREEIWGILAEAVSFACTVDVELVTPRTSFGNVGLDSFALTATLAEVEEVLETELPLELLERLDEHQNLNRVGDIYSLLVD
ncbi:MAG: phosphopantetheine-binding protein [Ilumatobacteraceae bacterium]